VNDYDRKCNMDDIIAENLALGGRVIRKRDKKMRGTGVEPVSLAAPDPKSGTPAGSITRAEGEGVTERHTAPSNASPTTTESTTCAESRRLSLGAGQ
jgi:hypothetical protein